MKILNFNSTTNYQRGKCFRFTVLKSDLVNFKEFKLVGTETNPQIQIINQQ